MLSRSSTQTVAAAQGRRSKALDRRDTALGRLSTLETALRKAAPVSGGRCLNEARRVLIELQGSATFRDDMRSFDAVCSLNRNPTRVSLKLNELVARIEAECLNDVQAADACSQRLTAAVSGLRSIDDAAAVLGPKETARLRALCMEAPEFAAALLAVSIRAVRVQAATSAALQESLELRLRTSSRWLEMPSQDDSGDARLHGDLKALAEGMASPPPSSAGRQWRDKHVVMDTLVQRIQRRAQQSSAATIKAATDWRFRREVIRLAQSPAALGISSGEARNAKKGLNQLRGHSNSPGVVRHSDISMIAAFWRYRARRLLGP